MVSILGSFPHGRQSERFLEENDIGVGYEDQSLKDHDEESKLFWILVFWGIVSASTPERIWFVHNLRIVSGSMKIRSAVGAEEVLEMILWSKEWERYLEVLWTETHADLS